MITRITSISTRIMNFLDVLSIIIFIFAGIGAVCWIIIPAIVEVMR